MSKIDIEDIRKQLKDNNWELLSTEYKNLTSEIKVRCDEGHEIYSTWGALRTSLVCPICKNNHLKTIDRDKVVPKKKDEIRVLGIDQATHTSGYAIINKDEIIKCGAFETNKNEDEAGRLLELRNWFISMVTMWKPDFIQIEGVQYQDKTSEGAQMGPVVFSKLSRLQGVFMVTARELNIPLDIVPTNTWRSFNGVKGRTRQDKKTSMKNIVKSKYDITVTDDCADAIGIATYGLSNSKGIVQPQIKPIYKMLDW